jgi:hypothetical protein
LESIFYLTFFRTDQWTSEKTDLDNAKLFPHLFKNEQFSNFDMTLVKTSPLNCSEDQRIKEEVKYLGQATASTHWNHFFSSNLRTNMEKIKDDIQFINDRNNIDPYTKKVTPTTKEFDVSLGFKNISSGILNYSLGLAQSLNNYYKKQPVNDDGSRHQLRKLGSSLETNQVNGIFDLIECLKSPDIKQMIIDDASPWKSDTLHISKNTLLTLLNQITTFYDLTNSNRYSLKRALSLSSLDLDVYMLGKSKLHDNPWSVAQEIMAACFGKLPENSEESYCTNLFLNARDSLFCRNNTASILPLCAILHMQLLLFCL